MASHRVGLVLLENLVSDFTVISKVAFIKTGKTLLYLTSFEDTVFFSYTLKFCT